MKEDVHFGTIGVIGLGLIGSSLCRGLKSSYPARVLGYDTDEQVMEKAFQDGCLDGVLSRNEVRRCQLLLIAVFPDKAREILKRQSPNINKDCLVVDCCGVKESICELGWQLADQYGYCFIGGHPMGGRELSGYDAGRADLFRDAPMVLCPRKGDEERAKTLFPMLKALGFSRVIITTPKEHDRRIAYTSQLAHVVASAYARSPMALKQFGFAGGSFADLTRVAQMNETMWTQLFLENAEALRDELHNLIVRLLQYEEALQHRDADYLFQLLREGRIQKENSKQMREDGDSAEQKL